MEVMAVTKNDYVQNIRVRTLPEREVCSVFFAECWWSPQSVQSLGKERQPSYIQGIRLEMTSTAEITFDGTKFYWRTRNTVDVVIAHHKECQIFEVIVYEPTLDREAPRLYLDEKILMPKVDHNEINSKISFANRNDVPLTEKFVTGIVNKAVADFVLNRLVIQELVASEKRFVVGLVIDDNDVMISPDFKNLVCVRPEALEMHHTKHYRNLMYDHCYNNLRPFTYTQLPFATGKMLRREFCRPWKMRRSS
jgi:hypothetical protein